MITGSDFSKKQIVFIFFNEGEKLGFQNDNIVVRTRDEQIKFQCTCYRLFLIYAVGRFSMTSVLLDKAKKFGFSIALLTNSFRLYSFIGSNKEGNTLLKKEQYMMDDGLVLAKWLVKNKIYNQYHQLICMRYKTEQLKISTEEIRNYYQNIDGCDKTDSLMAYEGLASKSYFKAYFDNVNCKGRKPRTKIDSINTIMDIGYTILFSFVESLLNAYGFDTYCGIFHKQFYLRKSLVCDMVEPFRYIIDKTIKKGYNLRQIKENDFVIKYMRYELKWQKSPEYARLFIKPLLDNRDEIFNFFQAYYRCIMKRRQISDFPFFDQGVVKYGIDKL